MGPRPNNISPDEWRLMGEQNLLRHDMETAQAYCDQRPHEATGIRLDRGDPATIVAYFASDLDRHAAALSSLLDYPDRLHVVRSSASKSELEAIVTRIHQMTEPTHLGEKIATIGMRVEGYVSVMLRPSQEPFAEELKRHFGNAVEISCGEVQVGPAIGVKKH